MLRDGFSAMNGVGASAWNSSLRILPLRDFDTAVRAGLQSGAKQPYICHGLEAASAPFVYRLGRQIFNLERRVRLP